MTKEDKYYVYKVVVGNEVIYVGKGKGHRSSHVLSGKSHNFKLNEYYFKHLLLGEDCPVVKKVKYFAIEQEALRYETYLIKDLLPDCNIRCTAKKEILTKKITKKKPKPKVKKKVKSKAKDSKIKSKTLEVVTPIKPIPSVIIEEKVEDELNIPVEEEDITIEVPQDYDGFYKYMGDLYEEYISQSVAVNPHPLKWFCYSKRHSARWSPYAEYLDEMFRVLDLEHKNNPQPLGRKKGFPLLLGFTIQEKNAFYRMQTKKGLKLDPNNEDDYEYTVKWLEDYRK